MVDLPAVAGLEHTAMARPCALLTLAVLQMQVHAISMLQWAGPTRL